MMVVEFDTHQRPLERFGKASYHFGHRQLDEDELNRVQLLPLHTSTTTLLPDRNCTPRGFNDGAGSSLLRASTTAGDSAASPDPRSLACASTTGSSSSEAHAAHGLSKLASSGPNAAATNTSLGSDTMSIDSALNHGHKCGTSGRSLPLRVINSPTPVDRHSQPRKRHRATHDVDGPGTGHLPCKKRRLRLRLITSRLSQPFSLPATHILNREADEDTPVLSRFVKFAALGAKKAGHQTALVRKAAILNRVRLNVRQAAVTRGHDRIYRMAGMGVMAHGLQLVTASEGAMFPGRSGEQVPGPIVPRAWRPHTTALNASASARISLAPTPIVEASRESFRPPPAPRLAPLQDDAIPRNMPPPPTNIMTPMVEEEDESSFPAPDLDTRYADLNDDDMDGVYADFGVLFGGGSGSPERSDEDDHFYEEYLDEVDGITWAS
ncbi:hypothetical protein BJ170DRAFT_368682 [Xylariales sp. AK1849]|nr:hypothetical protein BJ170DRAFT_368682 [Xylariales sp. AK1849]